MTTEATKKIFNEIISSLEAKDAEISKLTEQLKDLKAQQPSKEVKETNKKLREQNKKLKSALDTLTKATELAKNKFEEIS